MAHGYTSSRTVWRKLHTFSQKGLLRRGLRLMQYDPSQEGTLEVAKYS